MSLHQRIAAELVILVLLSIGFLLLFPKRSLAVDIMLALFALALIGLNANFTKNVVWGRLLPEKKTARWGRCITRTMLFTFPAVLIFLTIGIAVSYNEGGWARVAHRIFNGNILIAFGLYLPWALVQQTLFQFYLLGRLRALSPSTPSLVHSTINGLAYGSVHFPDVWITLVTAVGGIIWSLLYLRYRQLLPIAISHALLGSTFYYWVYGRDLVKVWTGTMIDLGKI